MACPCYFILPLRHTVRLCFKVFPKLFIIVKWNRLGKWKTFILIPPSCLSGGSLKRGISTSKLHLYFVLCAFPTEGFTGGSYRKPKDCKVTYKGGPGCNTREVGQRLTSAPQGSSQDCSSITGFVIYPIKSLSAECSTMNARTYFPFKIPFLLQQHL